MGIKKFLAIFKWRIVLGNQYIGVLGMGLVIVKTLQDVLKSAQINIPIYVLFPLAIITLWYTGFLADKHNIYWQELNYASEKNPFFQKYLVKENGKKIQSNIDPGHKKRRYASHEKKKA